VQPTVGPSRAESPASSPLPPGALSSAR